MTIRYLEAPAADLSASEELGPTFSVLLGEDDGLEVGPMPGIGPFTVRVVAGSDRGGAMGAGAVDCVSAIEVGLQQ